MVVHAEMMRRRRRRRRRPRRGGASDGPHRIAMTAAIVISMAILRGDPRQPPWPRGRHRNNMAEAFSIDPPSLIARPRRRYPMIARSPPSSSVVRSERLATPPLESSSSSSTGKIVVGTITTITTAVAALSMTTTTAAAAAASASPPPPRAAASSSSSSSPPQSPSSITAEEGAEGGDVNVIVEDVTPSISTSTSIDEDEDDGGASPPPEVEASLEAEADAEEEATTTAATAASLTMETKALLDTAAATSTSAGAAAVATAVAVDDDNSERVALLTTVSFVLLSTVSFAALVAAGGPGAWRYYVAGGICASVSHAITTPIDVVKTRQQVDYNCPSDNLVQSLLFIVRNDGVRALLAGLGPTTVGYLFEGAIKFGIYEVLKPFVTRTLASMASAVTSTSSSAFGATLSALLCSRLFVFSVCAAVSGLAASAMLCPMEALRIRMVAEPHFARRGWVDGGVRMVRREGVGGLFKGLTAMAAKQVPYTITKQVSFDFFATRLYDAARAAGLAVDGRVKFGIPFVSAVLASVLSCVASQPGDMLLSLVNAHEGRKRAREFAGDIIRRDGLRGFLVGIKARFVHVGVIVTIQLLIYDFVKRLCGIAATGSAG